MLRSGKPIPVDTNYDELEAQLDAIKRSISLKTPAKGASRERPTTARKPRAGGATEAEVEARIAQRFEAAFKEAADKQTRLEQAAKDSNALAEDLNRENTQFRDYITKQNKTIKDLKKKLSTAAQPPVSELDTQVSPLDSISAATLLAPAIIPSELDLSEGGEHKATELLSSGSPASLSPLVKQFAATDFAESLLLNEDEIALSPAKSPAKTAPGVQQEGIDLDLLNPEQLKALLIEERERAIALEATVIKQHGILTGSVASLQESVPGLIEDSNLAARTAPLAYEYLNEILGYAPAQIDAYFAGDDRALSAEASENAGFSSPMVEQIVKQDLETTLGFSIDFSPAPVKAHVPFDFNSLTPLSETGLSDNEDARSTGSRSRSGSVGSDDGFASRFPSNASRGDNWQQTISKTGIGTGRGGASNDSK